MAEEIRIRRHMTIGSLDAESDEDLLAECFIESDELCVITDVKDPKSLVIGRTGAGKTALLLELKRRNENVLYIDPHEFAFSYVENSNVIKFLDQLGVKLDLFYKLLWRHVLVVELLKYKYNIDDPQKQASFWRTVDAIIPRNKKKKEALEYLREWDDKFWEETEIRVRELTNVLEGKLRAALGSDILNAGISARAALSREERQEVVQRASRVVDELQIKKLSKMVEILSEDIFDDKQEKYYVVFDKLDEEWTENSVRYRLIRALIEEIKTFRSVQPVKIIAAIREDPLLNVFDKTRGAGFQEEKYDAHILRIRWSDNDLLKLIERRINVIFKRAYQNKTIGFGELLPKPRNSVNPKDYIIERTMRRPRDLIQYFNICLEKAEGRPRISWDTIHSAEATYSDRRLKSLYEEWEDIYPNLASALEILRGLTATLRR